jgi:acetyltransferase
MVVKTFSPTPNTQSPIPYLFMLNPIFDPRGGEHQTIRAFFEPKTMAVIGFNRQNPQLDRTLLTNLRQSHRQRPIYLVNPHPDNSIDLPTYSNLQDIPVAIDLAIITAPASEIPAIIAQSVEKQVKCALILSTGFRETGKIGENLLGEIKAIAGQKLRIIGPHSLGISNFSQNLYATFSPVRPQSGSIALISQSGAIIDAVLDWSLSENVGFSHVISLGVLLDVDWGELLYYLGDDPQTKSIVIYLESLNNARAFLSSAREVALNKPIIAISRHGIEFDLTSLSHAGKLTSDQGTLSAAFARCGIVEVQRLADLLNITKVLAKIPRLPQGKNLTIISNGAAPALLAASALLAEDGQLATLSPDTIEKLSPLFLADIVPQNPIDLRRSTDPNIYARTLEIALADAHTDAVLIILSPRFSTDVQEIARRIVSIAQKTKKPILASLMGGEGIAEGEALLNQQGIPTYRYPDSAVRVFNLLWKYQENLHGLYQTPILPNSQENSPDRASVSQIITNAAARTILSESESLDILKAYGIPVIATKIAQSAAEAVNIAESFGYPLVMKLYSQTIIHKSAVGGVQLPIFSATAARQAYQAIEDNITTNVGSEHFLGVIIQPYLEINRGYELIIGSNYDNQFGPVIICGAGGRLVDILQDYATALPPLNTNLARRLLEKTKIYQAFTGINGIKPVNLVELEQIIVKFSQLVSEQPRIKSIDINPFFVDSGQLIALSASIVLHPLDTPPHNLSYSAIRPYPEQYISEWTTKRVLQVVIRPIRAADEPLVRQFHNNLSEETIYYRYFHLVNLDRQTAYDRLTRICFIDYERVMALVVEINNPKTEELAIIAIGRLNKLHGVNAAEFDLLVGDDYQGHGLGTELLQRLVTIGKKEGLDRIEAEILRNNRAMQTVAAKVGFSLQKTPDFVKAELDLS